MIGLLIYLITVLVVSYIHAHLSISKGKKYDLRGDWVLCMIWPIVTVAVIYLAATTEDLK